MTITVDWGVKPQIKRNKQDIIDISHAIFERLCAYLSCASAAAYIHSPTCITVGTRSINALMYTGIWSEFNNLKQSIIHISNVSHKKPGYAICKELYRRSACSCVQ